MIWSKFKWIVGQILDALHAKSRLILHVHVLPGVNAWSNPPTVRQHFRAHPLGRVRLEVNPGSRLWIPQLRMSQNHDRAFSILKHR